jgi:uncharacterized protein with GYD domain
LQRRKSPCATKSIIKASLVSIGAMPHYIILFNFTEQGIRNVKDTIKRAENYKAAVEDAGGRVISEYYTFGKHDIVTIVEAPNDEAIMSVLLSTGKLGNTRSETLKAFPLSQASEIIEKLS